MNRRLAELIKVRGISRKNFALQLGISEGQLSEWINGKVDPSARYLLRISEEFNVNLNWLLGDKGPMFLTDLSGAVIDAEKNFSVDPKIFEAKITVPSTPLALLTIDQLNELLKVIESKIQDLETRLAVVESRVSK